MAARKVYRETTQDSTSFTRPRDSIIDEFPPEVTEKMGYVWVVKGTLSDEEEREAAKFGSLPDIDTLPMHEISSCTLAKEKVHELIVPGDYWAEGRDQLDRSRGTTGEEFRLYIPSFIRRMHSLFSRPPELVRKDTLSFQNIIEQMPADLSDRPSYIQHPNRYLDYTNRLIQEGGERSSEFVEPKPEEEEKGPDLITATEPEIEAKVEPEEEKKEEEPADRDINAIYADPEIEWVEPPVLPKSILLESKFEKGEPSKVKTLDLPKGRKSSEMEPFYVREYILRKVEDLENRLKSVNQDISGTKDRRVQLEYQLYEMEIWRLVEKISNDETPSETDIAKLEYLTDQLKLAQGKKTTE